MAYQRTSLSALLIRSLTGTVKRAQAAPSHDQMLAQVMTGPPKPPQSQAVQAPADRPEMVGPPQEQAGPPKPAASGNPAFWDRFWTTGASKAQPQQSRPLEQSAGPVTAEDVHKYIRSGDTQTSGSDDGLPRPDSPGSGAPLVTADVAPNRYSRSVDADRAAAEAKKEEAAKAKAELDSRDESYEKQPDVIKRRKEQERQRIWDEYQKNQGIVQRKNLDEIKKEVDADGGVKDFGSTSTGMGIGSFLDRAVGSYVGAAGKLLGWIRDAPKGTSWSDWSKEYDKNWNADRYERMHDMANNMAIQADSVRHGAESVGRFAGKWIDPRSWIGSDISKQLNRQAHDNATANADAKFNERQARRLAMFSDPSLRDPTRSGLAAWNYGGNAAVGEFAGAEAATAGIGTVAKGAGKIISAGGAKLGTRAGAAATNVVSPIATRVRYARSGMGATGRNLEASRRAMVDNWRAAGGNLSSPAARGFATPQAYRQAWARGMGSADPRIRSMWARQSGTVLKPGKGAIETRVGNAVNTGVRWMGDTVAAPFTVAGQMSTPITTTSNAIGPTVQAALFRPVRGIYSAVRHPVNSARAVRGAVQYARQHPWRATGNVLWSPVMAGWSVVRPGLGQALRTAFSKPGMHADMAFHAGVQAANQQYGSAAGEVAAAGAMGALGWKSIPLLGAYYAINGGGNQE